MEINKGEWDIIQKHLSCYSNRQGDCFWTLIVTILCCQTIRMSFASLHLKSSTRISGWWLYKSCLIYSKFVCKIPSPRRFGVKSLSNLVYCSRARCLVSLNQRWKSSRHSWQRVRLGHPQGLRWVRIARWSNSLNRLTRNVRSKSFWPVLWLIWCKVHLTVSNQTTSKLFSKPSMPSRSLLKSSTLKWLSDSGSGKRGIRQICNSFPDFWF
jgi:hypothetical protein